MPELMKLLARNLFLGVLAGWITLGALVATNVGGLYGLVFGPNGTLLPIILLGFGFTVTFGSLAMGAAIMLLPYAGGKGQRGLKVPTILAALKAKLAQMGQGDTLRPVRVKDDPQRLPSHRYCP